jgi:phosphoglycerol transferase MdoB-like AlkP superfamily enzyme
MAEMGYTSAFLHGGSNRSMNFQSFGLQSGVTEFWFREEYENERGQEGFDNHWGIFDHIFLPYAVEKISSMKEPFFATLFTLSSHHPYVIPDEFKGKFPKGTTDIDETIAYPDHALRIFFDKISKQPYFNNTLFVFVADHASGADNDIYNKVPRNYRIPILFYMADGSLRGSSGKMAKHLDLMPTLLGMLGYEKPFFSFGRDLFDESAPSRGVIYSNGTFNMVNDSLVVMFDETKVVGAYNYITDPMLNNDISSQLTDEQMNIEFIKAYIQQYYRYIKQRNFTANQPSEK